MTTNRRHFLGLSAACVIPSCRSLDQARSINPTVYPYSSSVLFGAGVSLSGDDLEIARPLHLHEGETDDELAKKMLGETSGFGAMAAAVRNWRVAKSLLLLRQQINDLARKRSREDDGFIGDESHQTRESDHNPWIVDGSVNVVSAFDITHDRSNGCDMNALAESLANPIGSIDPRIKYIIWNRQIWTKRLINGRPSLVPRAYTGKSPHDEHLHLSVMADKALYDSVNPWTFRLTK